MRITSGTFRGRKLNTPEGNDIRPASDRIRQSIFNMLLQFEMPMQARVIDAFCGTGSYGLEALSRDAASAIFFDNNNEALTLCRKNCAALNVNSDTKIIRHNLSKSLQNPDKNAAANLLFIDPPYKQDLLSKAIQNLIDGEWIDDGCICVMEMEKQLNFNHPNISILKDKTYGSSRIMIGEYNS